MHRSIRVGAAVVAAGALLGGATAGATAKTPKRKTVRVYDNYYGTAKLKVKPGTKVTWVWPSDVGDTHDVTARSVPKGVKKFQSSPYATAAKWSRKFTKPGRYQLFCSFHETEMTMTVTVTRH